jgi:hypothetical protein
MGTAKRRGLKPMGGLASNGASPVKRFSPPTIQPKPAESGFQDRGGDRPSASLRPDLVSPLQKVRQSLFGKPTAKPSLTWLANSASWLGNKRGQNESKNRKTSLPEFINVIGRIRENFHYNIAHKLIKQFDAPTP